MIGTFLPKDTGDKSTLTNRWAQYSSIQQIHLDSGKSMEELIRGDISFGGLMSDEDIKVIPSPNQKGARSEKSVRWFAGGYSLRRLVGLWAL